LDVDEIGLAVEPLHVIPDQRFHERVVAEEAGVLGEIGVVDARGAQAEQLGATSAQRPIGPGVLMISSVKRSRWT